MSFLENRLLEVGFNLYDENIYEEDSEFLSFLNVIPYQRLIRESTDRVSKVSRAMVNSKHVKETIKILEADGVFITPSDREDIARFLQRERKVPDDSTMIQLKELLTKQKRIMEPETETNLKKEKRLKVARHVFYQGRIHVYNYDFLVDEGYNILPMSNVSFYKDLKGNKNDPANIIQGADEFYFNSNKVTFNTQNVPFKDGIISKDNVKSLKEIKTYFDKLIRQTIYFQNEATYDLVFYWVLHTFLFKIWSHTPYLNIVGSTSSGKSTLLKFISFSNPNSQISTVPTTATLFRLAHSGVMLLWDESDQLRNIESEDTKAQVAILRAGFDHDTCGIPRCNQDNEVETYSSFVPKILCCEHDLPDTLESLKNRMLHIMMVTSKKPLRDISYKKNEIKKPVSYTHLRAHET